MAWAQHFAHNANDVGGVYSDKHAINTTPLDSAEEPLADVIEKSATPYQYWEYQTHALYLLLMKKAHFKAGAIRRSIEQLPYEAFQSRTYYEKWALALARVTIE
jgi:hypothetical protein